MDVIPYYECIQVKRMQVCQIRLVNSFNEEVRLTVSSDYTLYELKKEAEKIYLRNLCEFDMQLNGRRLNDLKLKIYELSLRTDSIFRIVERLSYFSYNNRIMVNITWQDVSYSVSLDSNSKIIDLKTKILQMLGLTGSYCIKYGQIQLQMKELVIPYVYSTNLSLQQALDISVQKENQNLNFFTQVYPQTKKSFTRLHSLEVITLKVEDEESHQSFSRQKIGKIKSLEEDFLDSQVTTLNQMQLNSTQNYFRPKYPNNISNVNKEKSKFQLMQFQAKQTLSINSSADNEQQFNQIYAHISNYDKTKLYTIQCSKDFTINGIIHKLANLQNQSPKNIILSLKNQQKIIQKTTKVSEITDFKNECYFIYAISGM